MVDGVHGDLDHVVRHVVEEYRIILECVMILNLHVEEKNVTVLALIHSMRGVMILVVQVKIVLMFYHYHHFLLN